MNSRVQHVQDTGLHQSAVVACTTLSVITETGLPFRLSLKTEQGGRRKALASGENGILPKSAF